MINDRLKTFKNQGFIVWPKPINENLLKNLTESVAYIQKKAKSFNSELSELFLYEKDLSSNNRSGVSGSQMGDSIFIIGDPARFDSIFMKVLQDSELIAAATSLLDESEVITHFMNVTIKNPQFGRSIAWHRDYPNSFFCNKESSFIRLMICLDGMSATNGATCFDIGSHKISDHEAEQQKTNAAWPCPRPESSIALHCKPGQIVAIDPKVLHGGGMNTGRNMRRNIILQVGKIGAEKTAEVKETLTDFILKIQ